MQDPELAGNTHSLKVVVTFYAVIVSTVAAARLESDALSHTDKDRSAPTSRTVLCHRARSARPVPHWFLKDIPVGACSSAQKEPVSASRSTSCPYTLKFPCLFMIVPSCFKVDAPFVVGGTFIGKHESRHKADYRRSFTSAPVDDAEYTLLRRELMGGSRVQAKLPRFLISCRTVQEFWSYISSAYGKYGNNANIYGKSLPLFNC